LHAGSAEFGVDCRRQIADAAVRPNCIVVVFPKGQNLTGVRQGCEQRLVEQFVPQASVEALDEGILLRLAGRDVLPFDLR
jgi:hypothetical protein